MGDAIFNVLYKYFQSRKDNWTKIDAAATKSIVLLLLNYYECCYLDL